MTQPIADPNRVESNWRAITAELDAPSPGRVEAVLRRLGLPATVTRVIAATPALRRAWYLAIGIAVLVGLGAAEPGNTASLFTLLAVAPVVPVLGVALAFGPSSDPMYEVQLAAPTRGVWLVAIRSATVLVVSIAVIGVLAGLDPDTRPMAAAWLLPALALTLGTIAVMTVLTPRRAAGTVTAVWFVTIGVVEAASSGNLTTFGVVGQAAAVLVAVVAAAVVLTRRDRFDRLEYLA